MIVFCEKIIKKKSLSIKYFAEQDKRAAPDQQFDQSIHFVIMSMPIDENGFFFLKACWNFTVYVENIFALNTFHKKKINTIRKQTDSLNGYVNFTSYFFF